VSIRLRRDGRVEQGDPGGFSERLGEPIVDRSRVTRLVELVQASGHRTDLCGSDQFVCG